MNNRKALLLWNRCRSNPPDLKFNLHVSIDQSEAGTDGETIDLQTDPEAGILVALGQLKS